MLGDVLQLREILDDLVGEVLCDTKCLLQRRRPSNIASAGAESISRVLLHILLQTVWPHKVSTSCVSVCFVGRPMPMAGHR